MLPDPAKRLVYQKLGAERKTPPNALLISNFLTPPTIDAIDLSGYTGQAGQEIKVLATDAIEVTGVTLRIRNGTGMEVESGPATKDHGVWIYRATATIPSSTTWKIEAIASRPAGAETRRNG